MNPLHPQAHPQTHPQTHPQAHPRNRSAPHAPRPRRLTAPLAELNAEWEWLARLADPAADWATQCPALAGARTVGDVLDAVRGDPDTVLLFLTDRCRAGDRLAGRVALQALLGKLVLMAARDASASLHDYVAAAWERIATYPVERRPRRVAANIVLDTLKTVRSAARHPALALPVGDGGTRPRRWGGDDVLAAAAELGLIDGPTRTTLARVYLDGLSSSAAAATLGTSAQAVRWRCSKGVKALRAHAPELARSLAEVGAA